MNDYNALLHRILRALAHADAATIDNVFACLVVAETNLNASMSMADAECDDARKRSAYALSRAAQHLWGSYPPEGIRVDNRWHYTVTA